MNRDMTAAEYLNSESGRAPDPRRQFQGAQNRASGNAFETLIKAACELYKQRGTAYIEKTPEPVCIISKMDVKGRFKACFEKQAQPDFKGTLAGGRAICFEAKYTDSNRIEQNRVTVAQAVALENHHELGAMCFILVTFGMQDYYRVPWNVWKNMKAKFGHMYMSAAELEPYRVKDVQGTILFLS